MVLRPVRPAVPFHPSAALSLYVAVVSLAACGSGAHDVVLEEGAGGSGSRTGTRESAVTGSDGAGATAPVLADGVGGGVVQDGDSLPADARGPCVELRAHGKVSPADATPFAVPSGESYQCFHFRSPFEEGAQGVVVESILEGEASVHHMLLYELLTPREDGSFEPCLGTHPDATLIAGWAPGAADLRFDEDVGMRLPDGDDGYFLLEVHYLNFGDASLTDRSGLRVCAAAEPRPHTASITWLGTENIGGPLGIPPGQLTTVSGSCTPGRVGIDEDDAIDLMVALPHMHVLGRRVEMLVHRTGGAVDRVLDVEFDADRQVAHPLEVTIHPGDRIETRCTYDNTTDWGVPWGPGSGQEMCYVFTLAYPAGALDNPVPSFAGATNTCFL